jgi:hypothetical protein
MEETIQHLRTFKSTYMNIEYKSFPDPEDIPLEDMVRTVLQYIWKHKRVRVTLKLDTERDIQLLAWAYDYINRQDAPLGFQGSKFKWSHV